MPRLILIVDDNQINREMLINALQGDYEIVEAANGKQALDIMHRKYKVLSAILLDIAMPVMDGYELLRRMRENAVLSQIPVIMVTASDDEEARVTSLSLGANDFISKPFNPTIVKHCLRNNIALRESASIINAIQRDKLTGLFNRETFFEKANEMIKAKEEGYYILSSFDIDGFKLINDRYGTAEGDRILSEVGIAVKFSMNTLGGLAGRISADNFVVMFPAVHKNNDILQKILDKDLVSLERYSIAFSVGRYIVNDKSLSASALYDRAFIAKQSIKGRYDEHLAYFDDTMLEGLMRNQEITNEMEQALAQHQFEVWFQPQYNHVTGALIGAEALVRWRHPTKGIVSPAYFIPLFEQNGFIYELDKFVWREVCSYIRKWINEGLHPLPVSVNISRYDVFRADLVDVISSYVNFYDIPINLLNLEITESAFTTSTKHIIQIIQQLVDIGFTVEIDDFGSGYSSLNILKSVPAQVVKLDMRFLEDEGDAQRGGNILESVVRMTKWLGMSVIAEGVETKEQGDFLKSIGCNRVQGYLYARPMPAQQYEQYFPTADQDVVGKELQTVENLDNNQFWNPSSIDTLIFNSFVGAACILEYHNGNIDLIRATDKYAAVLTNGRLTVEQLVGLNFANYFASDTLEATIKALTRSVNSKSEIVDEFVFIDLPKCPHETFIRSTLRVIATTGDRFLIYCISENITAQRLAERKERRLTKQLQMVMDNISCGITAITFADGKINYLLANDKYYNILGYTQKQYLKEVGSNAYTTVHPSDAKRVNATVDETMASGVPVAIEYRAVRRDGSVIWLRSYISVTTFEGIDTPVQLCTYVDISAEKLTAQNLLDNLPCGAGICVVSKHHSRMEYVNKRYYSYFKHRTDLASGSDLYDVIHPDDRQKLADAMRPALQKGGEGECVVRIQDGPDEYIPFKLLGVAKEASSTENYIYVTFTPITYDEISFAEMLPVALEMIMACTPDFAFVKDRKMRYICCSHTFAQLVGLSDVKQIAGKTDDELFDPIYAEHYKATDREIMESGESIIDLVESIPSIDGKNHYCVTSKHLLRDAAGGIIGLYGQGRDITAQREAEQQQQFLINSISGGVATYEGQWNTLNDIKLTYFSDGFCKLFGYTREEYTQLAKSSPISLIYEEYLNSFVAQINDLVNNGKPMDLIYKAHYKDGGYRWIHIRATQGERHGDNLVVHAVFFDVTKRQDALEHLKVSEEEGRLAMQHSKNMISLYDVQHRTLAISSHGNTIFALSTFAEDVPYSLIKEGKISAETADNFVEFFERIMKGEKSGQTIYQRTSTLGWRWIEAQFSTIFSGGKPVSAVISFADVTENYEKDIAYRKWLQSYENKNAASFTLLRCNISRCKVPEVSAGKLLNLEAVDSAADYTQCVNHYCEQYVYDEDKQTFEAFVNAQNLLGKYAVNERALSLEYREKLPNGEYRWLSLAVDLIEYPHSTDVEACFLFENIDKAKREELLTQEAMQTDTLTAVYNRTTFIEKLNSAIKDKPNNKHALLILDIDGFKAVNDVFGHKVGDAVLVDIGDALKQIVGDSGFVGRLGGDEFLIFIDSFTSLRGLNAKARKICVAMRKSYSAEVEVRGSVGMACFPEHGQDFGTLYSRADQALYYVKGCGGDNFALYREDMKDEHLKIELDEQGKPTEEKRRRMLIVDDSRMDYELLANIFRDDFIIEKAKDGNSALIRLRHYETAISVVLLDLMMPGMDGFAVLNKMRQSPDMRLIPVVVVSGDDSRETSLKAIKSGASDFVMKPVDPDILRIRVYSAISKAENERLRAQNSFLELQNGETAFYKSLLQQKGVLVIEADYEHDRFMYNAVTNDCIAGNYDERTLWHILLADGVAKAQTVKRMQQFVQTMAFNEEKSNSINVTLMQPSGSTASFSFTVTKLQDKLLLIFKKN